VSRRAGKAGLRRRRRRLDQHATTDRDRQIAEAMGAVVDKAKDSKDRTDQHGDELHNEDGDDGAAGVLVPVA
jgi:hypothetical protein